MRHIRILLFFYIIAFSTLSPVFANEATPDSTESNVVSATPTPSPQQATTPVSTSAQTEEDKYRYFIGAKIGYSGIHINSIENKTIGKAANKYSTFVSSMPVGAFLGFQYQVKPSFGLRAELEYLYRLEVTTRKMNGYRYLNGTPPSSLTQQDATANVALSLEIHTVLANLYLDYYVTPRISVYGGVGIGIAIIESSTDAPSYTMYDDIPEPEAERNKINFACKIGFGSRFAITKHVAFDINASYIALALPSTSLGSNQLLRMQYGMVGAVEVLAGISYVF